MSSATCHLCLKIQAAQSLCMCSWPSLHFCRSTGPCPQCLCSCSCIPQLLYQMSSMFPGVQAWETYQDSAVWEWNIQSQVFNSEVIWDAWLYSISWWWCATVCTRPSIQMIFKIMLYQFIKNTVSKQPVVVRQPPPHFSPQIHLKKNDMTEKEKLRWGGGGSTSDKDVCDIFYYIK